MKQLRKILCVALVAVMVLGLAVTAFADDSKNAETSTDAKTGTGTITISNAHNSASYTATRVFEVTTSTVGTGEDAKTVYTYTTENQDLIDVIKAHMNETAQTGSCPWYVIAEDLDTETDLTKATVIHKKDLQDETWKNNYGTYTEAMGRGWLANNKASWADGADWYKSKPATGNSATIYDLPMGYYMVESDKAVDPVLQNTPVVSVNTVAPNAVIADKNPTKPGDPDKVEDKEPVVVGDTVNYTGSYYATNYVTEYANGVATTFPVVDFTINDTFTPGLVFNGASSIKSVKLYKAKQADGTFDPDDVITTLTTSDYTITDVVAASVTPATETAAEVRTNGSFKLNIPWATAVKGDAENPNKVTDYTSKYEAPCYVVVEYSMGVNKDILSQQYEMSTNKVKVTYNYFSNSTLTPGTVPGEPEVKVYTTGFSIAKRDAETQNVPLYGAQFILWYEDPVMIQDEDEDGNKLWQDEEETIPVMVQDGDKVVLKYYKEDANEVVTWVADKDQATRVTADNVFGTIEFGSLPAGDYKLLEVVAPDGYVPSGKVDDVKVEWHPDETDDAGKFTVYINGELVRNNQGHYTTTVLNGEGKSMPSTGGAGTVALVAVGAVLFLGTAVVLVSRKRLYNEG